MALRLSKKSVIVKIDIHNSTGFYSLDFIYKSGYSKLYRLKTSLLRKDFDLLRNSRPTVPMYADERELLVFRTFSQSVSVPKRVFRHAEGHPRRGWPFLMICTSDSYFLAMVSLTARTMCSSVRS